MLVASPLCEKTVNFLDRRGRRSLQFNGLPRRYVRENRGFLRETTGLPYRGLGMFCPRRCVRNEA